MAAADIANRPNKAVAKNFKVIPPNILIVRFAAWPRLAGKGFQIKHS
jgi:hypothetical protein